MGLLVGARVYNSGNISINSGAHTVLTFDSERYDYDTIHSTVANTDRLTCQTAGIYLLSGTVQFATHALGERRLRLVEGGVQYIAAIRVEAAGANVTELSIATIWEMAVSDYFLLEVYQNSGGALNVVSTAAASPEFMMSRIG